MTVMKLHFPKQKSKLICYRVTTNCVKGIAELIAELDNALLKHGMVYTIYSASSL